MPERLKYHFDFETRPYHEDSSEEEIEAIKNQVYIFDENIIACKELPLVSPFSVRIIFGRMEELAKKDHYGLLIDLTTSKIPDSKTRRVINQGFKKICNEVDHVAFCTGKNILMNTVIRFTMNQTDLDSYSVHKSVDGCIKALKSKLNE